MKLCSTQKKKQQFKVVKRKNKSAGHNHFVHTSFFHLEEKETSREEDSRSYVTITMFTLAI